MNEKFKILCDEMLNDLVLKMGKHAISKSPKVDEQERIFNESLDRLENFLFEIATNNDEMPREDEEFYGEASKA